MFLRIKMPFSTICISACINCLIKFTQRFGLWLIGYSMFHPFSNEFEKTHLKLSFLLSIFVKVSPPSSIELTEQLSFLFPGLLKDYLRELPHSLLTLEAYQIAEKAMTKEVAYDADQDSLEVVNAFVANLHPWQQVCLED